MFTLNVPEYSVYISFPRGVASWMVANTAYIIAPPPPGEYVITVTDESYDFEYTVNLTVEAPQVFEPVCPNPEGGVCLGDLDSGTYVTRVFRPTLTYTVPEGWSNMEDLRGNFLLLPPGGTLEGVNAGTSDYLGVYTSVVPPGHCNGQPSTTVPHTFDGLVEFLTSNEAIAVSNRHDVSVGGLSGVAMDLEMAGTDGRWLP